MYISVWGMNRKKMKTKTFNLVFKCRPNNQECALLYEQSCLVSSFFSLILSVFEVLSRAFLVNFYKWVFVSVYKSLYVYWLHIYINISRYLDKYNISKILKLSAFFWNKSWSCHLETKKHYFLL